MLTTFLVSVVVYLMLEASPGNLARNVLGTFVTDEQEKSFLAQLGMDAPIYTRYMHWLFGSDWYAKIMLGMPLRRIRNEAGFEDLVAVVKTLDGKITKYLDNGRWEEAKEGKEDRYFFWGVDIHNHVLKWEKGKKIEIWRLVGHDGYWERITGGAVKYIPLKKGFIRGDPGTSLMTGRPVYRTLFIRFRNSIVLAGTAFVIVA